MARQLTWRELRDDLEERRDFYSLNAKIFALSDGWAWPLLERVQQEVDDHEADYDYTGRIERAVDAVSRIFRLTAWDTYEPKIDLSRRDGLWRALITVDRRHAAALSRGGGDFEASMEGKDRSPAIAILKAALGLRSAIADAEPTPEETAA